MGKNEFLSELEKSLSVLQEDELRDIISEYEQHIDIKVEKGLTEEEVIADFGSLSELTGEILEAYHVRVDYAAGRGKSRKKSSKVLGQESSENLQKLREMGEKGGTVRPYPEERGERSRRLDGPDSGVGMAAGMQTFYLAAFPSGFSKSRVGGMWDRGGGDH